jgi:hypothetical protein
MARQGVPARGGRLPTARHRPVGALGSRASRPGTIRSGLWPLAPPGNPHHSTPEGIGNDQGWIHAPTDMRVAISGLPYVKLRGIGAATYEDYTKRFGKAPSGFALYAVEAGRVAIDRIRRAADELDRARDVTERREAVRKAIATTKAFEGHIGKWSFDRNGDVDYEADKIDGTTSGFKVIKADSPIGCRFEFETILE